VIKKISPFLVISFLIACNNFNKPDNSFVLVEHSKLPDSLIVNTDSTDTLYDFHLTYCYAGKGSNMGTLQPYFEIIDSVFVYSYKQNSAFESSSLETDTLQKGIIRKTSIDSIIDLVDEIEDSVITKTNLGVDNGGLITVSIRTKEIKLTISMLNCYDTIADRIIQVLNTYISDKPKLIIDKNPPRDYGIDL